VSFSTAMPPPILVLSSSSVVVGLRQRRLPSATLKAETTASESMVNTVSPTITGWARIFAR
jgi:hypothetical protein